MDHSYKQLLERIRVPQPSLQRFAVKSVFEKLGSSQVDINASSNTGREVISNCLMSDSLTVIDQSVRELCILVTTSKLDVSIALIELQSALEGVDKCLVQIFVKAIGFLVRFTFQKKYPSLQYTSTKTHPFVKVFARGVEVYQELVNQVLMLLAENKKSRMVEACEFVMPFFMYSVFRTHVSGSQLSIFWRILVPSLSSFCSSLHLDGIPILHMLMKCLKYSTCTNAEDLLNFISLADYITDSYVVLLRQLSIDNELTTEAKECGIELLVTIISPYNGIKRPRGGGEVLPLLKRLISVYKDLGLPYDNTVLSHILFFFLSLLRSEIEHEQFSALKFILFLLNWKCANGNTDDGCGVELMEEILLIFPVIHLISSPSRSVTREATKLLFILEKSLHSFLVVCKGNTSLKMEASGTIRSEFFISNILKSIWIRDQFPPANIFILTLLSSNSEQIINSPESWILHLREITFRIIERKKAYRSLSYLEQAYTTETLFLLSLVFCVLVADPLLGSFAVDSLAAIGSLEPKFGITLFYTVMFYTNVFLSKDIDNPDMALKVLGMLPLLASQSVMAPLIIQALSPMLHKDANTVLRATAISLLCKTWKINDRTFCSLQVILLPKCFDDFASERDVCISLAASVREVCRNNPDRGVDLILSVSVCIENRDPIVRALGFLSLAHLCEADVIDFYTAWDVIVKHVTDYSTNPVLSRCVCVLLKCGALDAEANSEASKTIIGILWEIGTFLHKPHFTVLSLWAGAKASALEALIYYQISLMEDCIPNFKEKCMDLLISENCPEIIESVEGFEIKILEYEHITRKRFVKEKRAFRSKVEKLLDGLPKIFFSSGKNKYNKELPGAALFFQPSPKNTDPAVDKNVHSSYEYSLAEIATSIQISRNLLVAIITLQSWKPFMRHWLKDVGFSFNNQSSSVSSSHPNAAHSILKSMIGIAEKSIPRCAENIALSLGAFSIVLPQSAHAARLACSRFLLGWVSQHEHEHRQWTSAISLGLISSLLHITDHKQKLEIVNTLVKVAGDTKSSLVKGACGLGLGLLFQTFHMEDMTLEKPKEIQEYNLPGIIIQTLFLTLFPLAPSSHDLLEEISSCFPNPPQTSFQRPCDDFVDDVWGVAGSVLGFAFLVESMYRFGASKVVFKIKTLIILWFFSTDLSTEFNSPAVLSVGSCLALPFVAAFCWRVEMMTDDEVNCIFSGYIDLISELVQVRKSGIFHQSLLMAACVGAGNFVACLLNEGDCLKVELVRGLMDLFGKCCSGNFPHFARFGGMLGVINSLGSGAGIMGVHRSMYPVIDASSGNRTDGDTHIFGSLLSSGVCETQLVTLVQGIFQIAQSTEEGDQMKHYAAWALSFLWHQLGLKDVNDDTDGSKHVHHNISEDSLVMKLSLWLINHSSVSTEDSMKTTTSVIRCLSQSPRLPFFDWVSVVRRLMRFGSQFSEYVPSSACSKELREQCIWFSMAYGNHNDSVLTFLDELLDLPRFCSLEPGIQAYILSRTAELVKLFSNSRLVKLFNDLCTHMTSIAHSEVYSSNEKSSLHLSCWNGFSLCLDQVSSSVDYVESMEKCMNSLFSFLHIAEFQHEVDGINVSDEWCSAVRCLGKARPIFLAEMLKIDSSNKHDQINLDIKKMLMKSKLARTGSIPLSDLEVMKAYLFNIESHLVFQILVEVVAALAHTVIETKKQWLLSALEISCVSRFPSTALCFVGLLCGSLCKYGIFIPYNEVNVVTYLPVVLPALVSDPGWVAVNEPVVNLLWACTNRLHGSAADGYKDMDSSEEKMVGVLLGSLHHTCFLLREFLPMDKQLSLSCMLVN